MPWWASQYSPEAHTHWRAGTPQHDQSETRGENAMPTHSRNSTQNQWHPVEKHTHTVGVHLQHIENRPVYKRCKVCNPLRSRTFLLPQMKKPLSSCTSLSKLSSCSTHYTNRKWHHLDEISLWCAIILFLSWLFLRRRLILFSVRKKNSSRNHTNHVILI